MKFKKYARVTSLICVICCATTCLAVISAEAGTLVEGEYEYTVSNGIATITKCSAASTDITVPGVLGGYPVKRIGRNAFFYIKTIENLIIPEGVETIENSAFADCRISSVRIPKTLRNAGRDSFGKNGAKNVYITDFAAWCNIIFDNIHANPAGGGSGLYLNNVKISDLVIPPEITAITNYTFAKFDFDSVTLHDKLTAIGIGAFEKCCVPRITIPNSVKSIAEKAFSGCSNLQDFIMEDGGVSDKVIGDDVLSHCSLLCEVKLSDKLSSIGDSAFESDTYLKEINIPESVSQIGAEAFEYCRYLENANIPSGVRTVPMGMFCECGALKDVSFSNTANNVTEICARAFKGCSLLENIHFSKCLMNIGEESFMNCEKLCEIILPDTVVKIGKCAFSGCRCAKKLKLPNSSLTAEDGAFAGIGAEKIFIPEKVESIGNMPFNGAANLTEISVDEGNSAYKSIGKNLYTKDGKILLMYAAGNTQTKFDVPYGVEIIDKNAICVPPGCTAHLTEINIPNSVKTIRAGAFDGNRQLRSISLPDSVEAVEPTAFRECGLIEIYFPKSIKYIGSNTFPLSLKRIYYPGTKSDWENVKKYDAAAETCSIFYEYDKNFKVKCSLTRCGYMGAMVAWYYDLKYAAEQCNLIFAIYKGNYLKGFAYKSIEAGSSGVTDSICTYVKGDLSGCRAVMTVVSDFNRLIPLSGKQSVILEEEQQ